jgi:hypothetical protein
MQEPFSHQQDQSKPKFAYFILWDKGESRPELTINLGRMSKGKMIGVRYNQNLDWVGGTTYFLEKD